MPDRFDTAQYSASPAGTRQAEPAEHQRHHPRHHLHRLLLLRAAAVVALGFGAGVISFCWTYIVSATMHRQDERRVRLTQVPDQKLVVERHRRVDEWNRVQRLRQPDEALRRLAQRQMLMTRYSAIQIGNCTSIGKMQPSGLTPASL